MPANVALDLSGWQDVMDALDKMLTTDQQAISAMGAEAVGLTLDRIVRETLPPPPRKLRQPFKTEKQRRWWWYTMRLKAQGKSHDLPGWKAAYVRVNGVLFLQISGAYRRTGTLVKSMAWEITSTETFTGLRYGSNRQYAKYVVGSEGEQSYYHAGNWRQLQTFVRNNGQQLTTVYGKTIHAEMERRLGLATD